MPNNPARNPSPQHELLKITYARVTCAGFLVTAAQLLWHSIKFSPSAAPLMLCGELRSLRLPFGATLRTEVSHPIAESCAVELWNDAALRRERVLEGLTEAIFTAGILLIKWPSASAVLGRPKTDAYPQALAAERRAASGKINSITEVEPTST